MWSICISAQAGYSTFGKEAKNASETSSKLNVKGDFSCVKLRMREAVLHRPLKRYLDMGDLDAVDQGLKWASGV